MTRRHTTLPTSLGALLAVGDGAALIGLYFPGHWYPPSAETIGVEVDARSDPLFALTAAQLGEYLDGRRTTFDVPLATVGDDFREQVWRMLRDIPFGQTTTYGSLAERLGDRTLARRVGQAVGRNPLSILIPCHRVVGANGSLTGYAGGIERKQFLLELEGADVVAQQRLPKGKTWAQLGAILAAQPGGGDEWRREHLPAPFRLVWRLVGRRDYEANRAALLGRDRG